MIIKNKIYLNKNGLYSGNVEFYSKTPLMLLLKYENPSFSLLYENNKYIVNITQTFSGAKSDLWDLKGGVTKTVAEPMCSAILAHVQSEQNLLKLTENQFNALVLTSKVSIKAEENEMDFLPNYEEFAFKYLNFSVTKELAIPKKTEITEETETKKILDPLMDNFELINKFFLSPLNIISNRNSINKNCKIILNTSWTFTVVENDLSNPSFLQDKIIKWLIFKI